MPRANWEIDASDIDDWDRESQYTPYTGTVPPNGVYRWRIKVAKYQAGDRSRKPQLSLGLELVPRSRDEKVYEGYFAWKNAFPSKKNQFTYAPFCDAIGITGSEFTNKTIVNEDGEISRIGKWRNDGTTTILGLLEDNTWTDSNNNTRTGKAVGWVGVDEGDDLEESDAEDDAEDFDADEDYVEDEEGF
jgi:hypothetical protein